MSWAGGAAAAWPAGAGGMQAAAMGGQEMNMAMMGQCTPEQWAAMQQQNWQQWNQWQQQYAQWQSQYGDKYAAQMQAMQMMGGGSAPPLPPAQPAQPAPPPPDKPPPPPYENNQPLYQANKANHTTGAAPVPNAMLQASSGNTPNKDNVRPPARGATGWESNRSHWNASQQGDWNATNTQAASAWSTDSVSQNKNAATYDRNQQKQWSNSGHDSSRASTEGVNTEALKKHAEEERLFDIQFQKWEEEFEKWKKENVNHPDKQAYADYEQKFETCRAQLMERRQQMKQKRIKLMSSNIQVPAKDTPVKNVEVQQQQPTPTQPMNQQHQKNFNSFGGREDVSQPYAQEKNQYDQVKNQYDQVKKQFSQDQYSHGKNQYSQGNGQYSQDKGQNMLSKNQFTQGNKQYPQGNNNYTRDNNQYTEDNSGYDCYDQEPMENSNDSYSNSNFLSTGEQRKGIPGLDLVEDEDGNAVPPAEDPNIIDITEDSAKKTDFSAVLSKGINNILGDQKILNILSMVQGQKLQPNIANAFNQSSNNSNTFNDNSAKDFRKVDNSNIPGQNMGPNAWPNQNQNREGPMNQPKDFHPQNQHQSGRFNMPGSEPHQMNVQRDQPPQGRINDYPTQRANDFVQGANYNSAVPPPLLGRGNIPPLLDQDFRNNSFTGPPNMAQNPNMRQNMGLPNRMNQDMGTPNRGMNQDMGQSNRGMMQDMGHQNRGMNMDVAPPNRGMNQDMGPPNRGMNQDMGTPNRDVGLHNRGMNQDVGLQNRGMNLDIGLGRPMSRGMNQDMGLPNRGMNQDMGPSNRGMNQDMGPLNRGMNQDMGPLNRGLNQEMGLLGVSPDMGHPNRGMVPDIGSSIRGMNHGMGPAKMNQDMGMRSNIPDMGVQRPDMFMTQERGRGYGPAGVQGHQGPSLGMNRIGGGMGMNQGMGMPMNRGPNSMAPVPPVEPAAKWVDEPIMEPTIIVDYEHKPLRMKVRDFIEPVQTFDYNHLSNEKDLKKENQPSDRWSELDTYNQRSGTKVIDYQNKSMNEPPPNEVDRRLGRRQDTDKRDEPSDRRDRFSDRNFERSGDRRRDDRDDRRRDDRTDERRRDDRMRHDRNENRPRDRSRDRGDWSRDRGSDRGSDRGRDRDSRKRDRSKEKIKEPSIESIKSVKPNEKISSPGAGAKHLVMIDDLLESPGRDVRPEKLVIFIRGIPGSGKSYLAKLIKEREVENGGSAPRILSMDDYFLQETEVEEKDPNTGKMVKKTIMKYVYDEKAEEDYLGSLKRAYKRTVTDQFFPFIIIDAVSDQVKSFADMWNFGRQYGFQVYVCTMECDVQTAFKRNIHDRTLEDIQVIATRFFPTPNHYIALDATTLLQSASIQDVHMEDVNSDDDVIIMEDATEEPESETTDQTVSKWERMDDSSQLARLDGISRPLRPSQYSLDEYLQLDDWQPARAAQPGKKTVRWADIEERRRQEKMRAIGFVVGQTDWHRMTDPTLGSGALTQMKYIERTRRN